MRKLSLLLTLFSLLACRSPQEATQTVIRIRATESMQERIKSYQTQVITLPNSHTEIEPVEEAIWPVKRTFVPKSKSSSHHFRYVFTGLDDTGTPVTTLDIETKIVKGASRYLYILLSDGCLECEDRVCKKKIPATSLRTSADQARSLESGCIGGALTDLPVSENPSDTTARGGDDNAAGSGGPSGPNNTSTGTAPPTEVAADGGTINPTDAGPVQPPDTEAECRDNPCGEGTCHLNSTLPKGYACSCNSGFEPDEAAGTCVVRDDCAKPDRGGCEDICERTELGEARCSCTGDKRWLKADGKQCAEVQAEVKLTTSRGSVDRTRPQVAFDALGNGVVAWTETDANAVHSLWTARFRADTKEWDLSMRPFMVGTTKAADLHLALDSNGSGILIWTATVNAKRQLWAARYREGAFSSLPRPIDADGQGDVLMPALAIDAVGDGLVVWTDAIYPMSVLRVARYLASSDKFSEMDSILERRNAFVLGTSVAVNSPTSGLVAWTDVPINTNADGGAVPDFSDSNAFNSLVDGQLGQGIGFTGPDYRSTSPDIVMDAQGNALGVWVQALKDQPAPLKVVVGSYMPGDGWGSRPPQTLSDRGGTFSAPRITMGSDGSAFAAWRETTASESSTTMTRSALFHTYGALRTADEFGPAYELGRPSQMAYWNDIDAQAWTTETTVTFLDQLQPTWSIAAGPNHTGFIAGASFRSSVTPTTRELWLQRIGPDQEPAQLIRLSLSDEVPSRPSPVKLSLNANGDGAVVWDRQVDGLYHVYANVLD
jgi:hypothetical protein